MKTDFKISKTWRNGRHAQLQYQILVFENSYNVINDLNSFFLLLFVETWQKTEKILNVYLFILWHERETLETQIRMRRGNNYATLVRAFGFSSTLV